MSDFDVKEKRFEEDIEDYLTHHGGYTKGDPKKFNRESGLEEDTFVEFIKTSQPKKWERYVKIYAENSEKQIIERFKREVKTTNLLNVMRHGFMDRGIKFYPIFWKPETSLNETTQMQYDANILHCTRQLHYSVHNENSIDIVLFANGIPVVSMELKCQFTGQDTTNAINQYKFDRAGKDAIFEALKEKAFTGGAEKYLWIPPSLPYYEMQGAYKNSKGFSKILVFSAWEMVPRMIGALVSYEAERLTVGKLVHQIKNQDKKNTGYFADGSRRYPVARLRFNVSNGEVRGMSLFALLYPSKTLSDIYLPIESLNNHESLEVIEKSVRLKLKEKLAIIEEKYGDSGNNKEDARWYYLAPMLMDGVIYAKHWIEDIVWEMNTDEEDTTSEVRSSSKDKRNKGFIAHIDKLRSYLDAPEEIHLGRKPEDLLETLVNMVLGSPAICIYRSNGRSTARATSLAKVFVNNFNLPESTAIIDLAYGRCRDDNSHWQNVLKYCKDGCFQAMIDEYIHMLKETAGFQSDGNQYQIVHDMMMDSLKIHTATYIADTYPDFKKRINGADRKSDGCRIRSSYAVGFTKDAGDNSKVVMRKENIRNAFNSPMRPFVLATTSIGQEGLDFHNYCRVIMHWNLPSNPIDVGRILRTFKIKKNVEVTDNGKIII